jgi:O-antigen ligase
MKNKLYNNIFNKFRPPLLIYDTILLVEIAVSFFYIINMIISSISNYNTSTLLLKTASILFLLLTVIIVRNKLQIDCKYIFTSTGNLKVFIILSILLFILALSLIHTHNKIFGLQKFYLIVVQLVPTVIITAILLSSWNKNRSFAFTFNLIVIGISAVLISLLIKPFNPFSVYKFSVDRWSHVVFGRFLGIPVILSLYLMLKFEIYTDKIFWEILFLFLFIGLLLSGFRAGIIGIVLVFLIVIIYQITYNYKKSKKNNFYYILGAIVVLILFILIVKPGLTGKRFEFIKLNHGLEIFQDPGIKSRLGSYNTTFKIGKENLLFGAGLGGFNNEKDLFTNQMKYPHNIFLEFFSELGLIGLIFLITILSIIFKSTYKINPWITILYLFFLWLSLFSKDIPSNTILFTGIAFWNLKINRTVELLNC